MLDAIARALPPGVSGGFVDFVQTDAEADQEYLLAVIFLERTIAVLRVLFAVTSRTADGGLSRADRTFEPVRG